MRGALALSAGLTLALVLSWCVDCALGETVISFQYDDGNRLARVIDQDGREVASFSYDKHDRVVGIRTPEGEYRLSLDSAGRLLEVQDETPWPAVSFHYDAYGSLARLEADDLAVEIGFDLLGRLSRIDPGASRDATEYYYDDKDRLARIISPYRESSADHTFDRTGRLTSTVVSQAAHSDTISYHYSPDDGRLVAVRSSLGERSVDLSFDRRGRLSTITEPSTGLSRLLTFDGVGRLTHIQALGAQGWSPISYAYDADARLTRMRDATGWVTFEYDQQGRLALLKDERTFYGQCGGIALFSMDFPGGIRTFAYDDLERPTTIYSPGGGSEIMMYLASRPDRAAASLDLAGLVRLYSHDEAGNLIRSDDALGRTRSYLASESDPLTHVSLDIPAAGASAYLYKVEGASDFQGICPGYETKPSPRLAFSSDGKVTWTFLYSRTRQGRGPAEAWEEGSSAMAAWPNPLRGETTIRFQGKPPSDAIANVYDTTGRLVATLPLMQTELDLWDAHWAGTDNSGLPVAPGLYFVTVRADTGACTAKLVVTR